MSFTYSATSITTDVARMRLLIQDTDSTNYAFTDEELTAHLDLLGGNLFNAAATACETKARAQLTSAEQIRLSDGSSTLRRKLSDWLALAEAIRNAAASGALQTGVISTAAPNELLDSFRPDWRAITDLPVVE